MNKKICLKAVYSILMILFVLPTVALAATAWCGRPITPPTGPGAEDTKPCCECPENNCTGSPGFPSSGNYTTSATDLQITTRGFPITVSRNYDSVRMVDGFFGMSWSSNLTMRLLYTTYLFAAPSTYSKEAVVMMPNGRPYRFRENADGTTYTAADPNHYTLVRNGDGSFDLTPPASRARYHFASDGSLQTQTDEFGNSLLFTYDGSGRLYQVTDGTGSGRMLTFFYGPDGRVSSIQDTTGRTVSYTYNANGELTNVRNAGLLDTKYSYVAGRFAPLLSQISDHWNRVITTITYDTSDRLKTYTVGGSGSYTQMGVETYTYTYNYQNDPTKTSKQNSGGQLWVYTHDAQGLISNRLQPEGAGNLNTAFNPDGTIQLQTDEAGVKTSYTYNANGTVASITRDFQGPVAVRFDYTYDPNFPEKVTSIIPRDPSSGAFNPDWQGWLYDYYQSGSPAPGTLFHVYRLRDDGASTDTIATYTYNSVGQVLAATDATGGVTTYGYNPSTGDLISVTYPSNSDSGPNPVYQYGRDALGRVASVTDPNSNQTTYTYDALDRIISVTLPKPTAGSPLNFVTTYTYDTLDASTGLVITQQTDPNGKVTQQWFDQFGQINRNVDAAGAPTYFLYSKGLLQHIQSHHGYVHTYLYDGVRRLTTARFPEGVPDPQETYTYWPDGLLKTKTDRKGQTITYNYDRLKRLASKVYPNGTSVTYNYTGQKLTSVSDTFAGETHNFSYDAAYRVSANTQGTRGTVSYNYDPADRLATYSVSGGPSAAYAYYPDGSLNTITWSPVPGNFKYTYNLNGQYGSVTFPNGQHRDFSYDLQGRLTQIANIHPTAGNLATYAYSYDVNHYTGQSTMLGQRNTLTMNIPSLSFNNTINKYYYDANYQLNRADYPPAGGQYNGIESWTYDWIGNRTAATVSGKTKNYTYFQYGSNTNNSMRLQSDGTYSYTYDGNGNMLTQKKGNQTTNFTWDYENRLASITGSSYSYDYLGRRKSKTIGSTTTTYLYDGQNLIYELTGSSGADYLFGPGIDEPLAMSRSAQVYYYSTDGLGSVGIVSDAAGVVKNKYSYDAWGAIKSQTAAVSNPFIYTSREAGELSMHYYRARWMYPAIARFASEDPEGLFMRSQRDFNSYAYAGSNPIFYSDPRGLSTRSVLPTVVIDKSCEKKPFEKKLIQDALNDMWTKLATPCIGPLLAAEVWDAMDDMVIKCDEWAKKNQCGNTDVIQPFSNEIRLAPLTLNETSCGPIAGTLLHEVIHRTQWLPDEYLPYSCQYSCYDWFNAFYGGCKEDCK